MNEFLEYQLSIDIFHNGALRKALDARAQQ